MSAELIAVLFSWALSLSGLPGKGVEPPSVERVSHAWLVEKACGGAECAVFGWYPHSGGNSVYLDARLDPDQDLLAASVVVHEVVHYLQGAGGAFGGPVDCSHAVELERQAYRVQGEFLVRHGVYRPVGISMLRSECIR